MRPSTVWPISAAASSGDLPARDQLPGPAVAAARVPARDDQVAHAGETRERVRVAAGRLPQPPHLGQPSGHQRRLRVVAEAEAVDAAGREPDHVLRRRAQLDADEVGVRVDAKRERVDLGLELLGELHRPRRRSPPPSAAPPRSPPPCWGRRARRPAGRGRAWRGARRSRGRAPSSGSAPARSPAGSARPSRRRGSGRPRRRAPRPSNGAVFDRRRRGSPSRSTFVR